MESVLTRGLVHMRVSSGPCKKKQHTNMVYANVGTLLIHEAPTNPPLVAPVKSNSIKIASS